MQLGISLSQHGPVDVPLVALSCPLCANIHPALIKLMDAMLSHVVWRLCDNPAGLHAVVSPGMHCGCLQAGIFEEAPSDDGALADSWGLYLNCINSGLYMANYNVVIPTITNLCSHIGVSNSYSGLIIGACDVATVVSTIGVAACRGMADASC